MIRNVGSHGCTVKIYIWAMYDYFGSSGHFDPPAKAAACRRRGVIGAEATALGRGQLAAQFTDRAVGEPPHVAFAILRQALQALR